MLKKRTMGDRCLDEDDYYRDRPAAARCTAFPEETVYYARSVFDWSRSNAELAARCSASWQPFQGEHGLRAVYVIGPEGVDHAKIGIAEAPLDRLCQLQCGSWVPMKLHFTLWVYGAARIVEGAAHQLAKNRGIEKRREWVGVPAATAFGLVLDAARALDIDASDLKGIERSTADQSYSNMAVIHRCNLAEVKLRASRLGY